MKEWASRFSQHALRVIPSAIRGLDSIPRAADTISFGAGAPDEAVFPVPAINKIFKAILNDPAKARQALQYGPTEGSPRLRQQICDHMETLGVACAPENVLITNGAQQGIHLVSEALVNPGDSVLVEARTYPGALQVFLAHGATVATLGEVPGPNRVPLIYTTPTFQNPTGHTLSIDERLKLLARAREADAIVIEDDPYVALRYDGRPVSSLLSLDTADRPIDSSRVIYLGTFSKSIAPGFRIGWAVAARGMIERLALLKQTEDLQPSSFSQVALSHFLDGDVHGHHSTMCATYRDRRDRLAEALRTEIGILAAWTIPEGGYFFWLTLPENVDAAALLKIAAQTGVTFIPGAAFCPNGQSRNMLRLSFSNAPIDRFREGMHRLARALETYAAAV